MDVSCEVWDVMEMAQRNQLVCLLQNGIAEARVDYMAIWTMVFPFSLIKLQKCGGNLR